MTDHTDLLRRLRGSANFLDKAGFTGFPLIAKDCREAADSLEKQCDRKEHYKRILRETEADNAALREQVEAFRREQIARSKIDPVTRLHNLCDHLADQRRESPFTAESLELADASYKELCADNAALREQVAAKDADIAAIRELMNVYNLGGWTDAIAPMKRALAAEADNAALLSLVRIADEVRKQCRICPATVSYDFERARIAAMREGKK